MSLSAGHDRPSAYDRLAAYLEQDPDNLGLIARAADAAMEEGRLAQVAALVEHHARIAVPPPSLLNLLGLVAMAEARWADAAAIFESLVAAGGDDIGIRFNLAWTRSLGGDASGALEVLGPDVVLGMPAAAALRIRTLHRLGRLDQAMAEAETLTQDHDDPELFAALALVALDAEDPVRARSWATKAQNKPDGLATLGMLSLADDRPAEALATFDAALTLRPSDARSLLGKGMVLLIQDQAVLGAAHIDQAAEAFGDHPGSWIAAGWAHFVAGDMAAATQRFERALGLDDTFAESHGALAVVDMVQGRIENGRRRAETALRLDRACLSGALAQTLMLTHQGDTLTAARIRETALNTPGPDGRTLAQTLVRLGLDSPGPGASVGQND